MPTCGVYASAVLDAADLILTHQLLGRYGHAIDARDWDAFADLFVPEASIDYRGGTDNITLVLGCRRRGGPN